MKLSTFYFLIAIVFPGLLVGQSPLQIDSISKKINEANRFRAQSNFDQAIKIAQEALDASKIAKYLVGQADSYIQIGRALKGNLEFRQAIDAYQQAYDIRLNLKDYCGAASAKNNMVSALNELFFEEGDELFLKRALRFSRDAENLAGREDSQDCKDKLIRTYVNRANVYVDFELLDSAILANRLAANLLKSSKDTTLRINNAYGLIKHLIEDHQWIQAQSQLDSSFHLMRNWSNLDSLYLGQINEAQGIVKLNEGKTLEAIKYFSRSEAIYRELPFGSVALSNLYYNIAMSYEELEDYDNAARAYKMARNHYSEESDTTPFYQMMDTQEKHMQTKIAKKANDKMLIKVLIALVLLSITLAIISTVLYIKTRESIKYKVQLYQLRHDIVKNGLRSIENHISAGLPMLQNDQLGYNLVLKVRKMARRILTQIGYEDEQNPQPVKLKPFVEEMHQRAIEISLMEVQNYSYLDEVDDSPMSSNLRNNLEAIIIEAFTNIHKYSQCQNASINFSVDENGLTLLIQDDGIGCVLEEVERSGLNTIAQRVRAINGTLFYESSPDKGFSLKIKVSRFPEIE